MEQNEQLVENQTNEVNTTPVIEEQEQVKQFKYAKLLMACSCGHIETLQDHVEGGIRILIPATDKHKFVVGCPKCNTQISLYWEESTAPEVKVEEAIEEVLNKPEQPIEVEPTCDVDNTVEFTQPDVDLTEKEGREVAFSN